MLKDTISPNEIRATRIAWGINQGDMGRIMGVSGACVSGWEKGNSHCSGPAAVLFQILQGDDDRVYHAVRDDMLSARMRVLKRRMRPNAVGNHPWVSGRRAGHIPA